MSTLLTFKQFPGTVLVYIKSLFSTLATKASQVTKQRNSYLFSYPSSKKAISISQPAIYYLFAIVADDDYDDENDGNVTVILQDELVGLDAEYSQPKINRWEMQFLSLE